MSALALGWAMIQLFAACAIVAAALSAGVALAASGERRRLAVPRGAASRGRLSAQTRALMERNAD